MLVVDPLKRATISDIKKNPWFAQNLADYLANPKNIYDSSFDESIIQEISTVFEKLILETQV